MLGPLVILAVLSVCGGWIGIETLRRISRAGRWRTHRGCRRAEHSSCILSVVAVAGCRCSAGSSPHVLYRPKPARAGRDLRLRCSGRYKLLVHKYYVDEIYGVFVVKPLLVLSPLISLTGSWTWQSWAAPHGCSAASPRSAGRCCSAGSPAICAPTRLAGCGRRGAAALCAVALGLAAGKLRNSRGDW